MKSQRTRAFSALAAITMISGLIVSGASPAQAATSSSASCHVRYDNTSDRQKDLYSFSGPAVRLNASQMYFWTTHVRDHWYVGQYGNYRSTSLPARRTKHKVVYITGYIVDSRTNHRVNCVQWGTNPDSDGGV